MAAAGRTVRQSEHDVDMEAGLAVVAHRDVADRAQHLALLAYFDLPVTLRAKVEPADGCLFEGADRGQRCRREFFVIGEFGQRRERLFAAIENDDVDLGVRSVRDELAFHGRLSITPPSCGMIPRRPGTSRRTPACRRPARNPRRTQCRSPRTLCRCVCGGAY